MMALMILRSAKTARQALEDRNQKRTASDVREEQRSREKRH
jgi:hypothetical protein